MEANLCNRIVLYVFVHAYMCIHVTHVGGFGQAAFLVYLIGRLSFVRLYFSGLCGLQCQ